MKVKNLIIGDIVRIEQERIPMEDYYPSSFDEICNLPSYEKESLFYKVGNRAIDLIHPGCYKIIKEQEEYPDNLRNKKFVMLEQPFSDLSIRHTISRSDAILVYRNRRVK